MMSTRERVGSLVGAPSWLARPWALRARRMVARAVAVGALVGTATACEPCAGVVDCRAGAHLSYSGRIIDFESGRGVGGVTVVFRRTSGGALASETLTATTDADGRYRLASDASSGQDVVGEVAIRSGGDPGEYVVRGVTLSPSTVGGGGGVLPTWTSRPYVAWVGSIVSRFSGTAAGYGRVIFERTGGARLVGGDRIETTADVNGFFFLRALALDTGEVRGTLNLNGVGILRLHAITGVRLPVRVVDQSPTLDRVITVGSSFDYVVELHQRGSGLPLANADVEFRRTGGLRADSVVRGRTGADGRIRLAPLAVTDDSGAVTGDLTVRAPSLPRPFVLRGLTLPSFDSDELRFLGVFNVGYGVAAAGELYSRGERIGIAGADVQFIRKSGVASAVASVDSRSLPSGYFGIALATDTAGPVVGDLVVRRPGSAAPETFRDVTLRATADDSVRFAGRFAFGVQFSYAGVLINRATGTGAVGYTVTFQRTSGIPVVSSVFTSDVLSWGGFGLSPTTGQAGAVTGTLTAHEPGTGRDIPLGSVTLTTSESDSVVLAGEWRVGPSLLYVGELRRLDTNEPIVGARAEFRRTGGIGTADAVAGEVTNVAGRFRMAPRPLAAGDVIGDIYVFPAAPLRDTVFRNVRLATFESDETRLSGVWFLAGPR